MGLPHRLVKAASIAQGALSDKPPSLLLVPGGSARLKSEALGTAGREAVRAYVAGGGHYLGFCGGAGFALSVDEGIGLCPWTRAPYENRLHHLLSGHIYCEVAAPALFGISGETALPVWWPGRFEPQKHDGMEVAARCLRPAEDLRLADLPLAALPPGTPEEWEETCGIRFRSDDMRGRPCIIHGSFGRGSYTLSYAHLETPDSPTANRMAAHLLHELTGLRVKRPHCPPWDIAASAVRWDDPVLTRAREKLARILYAGLEYNLLFVCTPWLWGRRAGLPSAALNNLAAALSEAQNLAPNEQAIAWWESRKKDFERSMDLFCRNVEAYLPAERLASILLPSQPETVDRRILNRRRAELFGPAMEGGGLYAEPAAILDELLFLMAEEGES